MKIVCQNCSANYKIPDDKVQGKKVFKIKCKRCGEDILVRGIEASAETQAPIDRPADDEQTRVVHNEGTDAIWHAVLNGDQQGPFTVDQLRDLMAQGQIDTETYVWRDGFEGWQPMRDVAELAGLTVSAAPTSLPAAAEGGDLFAPSVPAAAEPRVSRNAEPAKARAASKAGDLFAPEARSEEISKSAFPESEKPAAASEHLTGQRNENSVLFSLATLQQLSDKNAKPTTPSPSDASGLIDINKLAGALNTSNGSKKSSVDDIMSVGATSGLASPLAAPVLVPVAVPSIPVPTAAAEPAKPQGINKTILATGVAVAAILVGGGVGAAYLMSRSNTEQQQPQNTALNTVNPTPQAGTVPSPTNPPVAAPVAPTSAPETTPTVGTPPSPASASGNTPESRPRERERERERERASSSSSSSANAATPPPSTAARIAPPPAAPTAPPARPSSSASIDDLLNRVASPTPRPSAPAAGASSAPSPGGGGDLPETPDRTTVRNALQSVASAVRACGTGSGGTAMVTVVFANTGRVTTATVGGIPPGPAVGCIVGAVRRATLPPFSRSTFSVTYPYPLN